MEGDMAVSVGFIGVGNMGNPMAGNILKAGFPMMVSTLPTRSIEWRITIRAL